jgi:hypothetical protein
MDCFVSFHATFKEVLALHIDAHRQSGASHLFELSGKKPYSDRGVRKVLARYATAAGIEDPISGNRHRHYLFMWLKAEGIDDAHLALLRARHPGNGWRSTRESRLPTPSRHTIKRSADTPSEPTGHLVFITPLVCGW